MPEAREGGRSALVLGATGLIGRHCLDLLLADERYRLVRVLGRRAVDRDHPKLVQHLVDLGKMSERPDLFRVDDLFSCLGTTIRKAGSREAFRQVDVEYPVTAASLALKGGSEQCVAVSALGADPDSRLFYNRAKGEMEEALRRLPFRAVWILRPALLLGSREEVRVGERVAQAVLSPLAPVMRGILRRYRPVQAAQVAAAMLALALSDGIGGILESEEIPDLAAGFH